MGKIWFTSDQHYFHNNVIKYCSRPYTLVEIMNEDMVRKFNAKVAPEDTVYMVGDFSLSHRAIALYLNRLNGKKIYISGNHDRCHPVFGKKAQQGRKDFYDGGVSEIHVDLMCQFENTPVRICHFPYSADHYGNEVRYLEFRPKKGAEKYLICGHVHDTWAKEGNQVNVGVDVWGGEPVSLEEVMEQFRTGDEKVKKFREWEAPADDVIFDVPKDFYGLPGGKYGILELTSLVEEWKKANGKT